MDKKIYVVGGYVRDSLLGTQPADKDFVAVGYTPSDFKDLQLVGKDFPVFLNKDGDEVALARTERSTGKGYSGFQCDVENVTLEEDLNRRDLTINAMALDQETGEVVDPFNGKEDMGKRTLRHVSDAFKEDPVRVLRIARLRAKLPGFWKIAPETKVLIYSMREDLTSLTQERVWKEVDRAMECNPHIFFNTLFELGVLSAIFPNIGQLPLLKEGSRWHMEPSVFDHTMRMLENGFKQGAPKEVLYAALFHDIAKPITYRLYGNGAGHDNPDIFLPLIDIDLPMPSKLRKKVKLLISNHLRIAAIEELKANKQVRMFDMYRGSQSLLNAQMQLLYLDDNNRDQYESDILPIKFYVKIFKAFSKMKTASITEWLAAQLKRPHPEAIKQEVLKQKKKLIKEDLTWKQQ